MTGAPADAGTLANVERSGFVDRRHLALYELFALLRCRLRSLFFAGAFATDFFAADFFAGAGEDPAFASAAARRPVVRVALNGWCREWIKAASRCGNNQRQPPSVHGRQPLLARLNEAGTLNSSGPRTAPPY